MKTVHVGFDHYIPIDNIAALLSPDGTGMRKRIKVAAEHDAVVNLCRGRRAKCFIVMKTGPHYLSALNPITIAGRMANDSG